MSKSLPSTPASRAEEQVRSNSTAVKVPGRDAVPNIISTKRSDGFLDVVQYFDDSVSLTVHSQAYDCDINNMVKGLVPFSQATRPAFFIDETNLPSSYEDQFNAVAAAQDAFLLLPPDVRQAFDNDPAVLAKALGDPSQTDRLVKLGVIPAPPPSAAKPSQKAPPKGGKPSEPQLPLEGEADE
jgi:hypothetical protein